MTDLVWIHSKEDLDAAIATGDKVVVRFTAEAWCAPCRQFAPHFERAVGEVSDVTFLSVDLDTNEWATVDFGVRSVPKVLLFDSGDFVREVKSPQGALPFINDIKG